MPVGVAVRPKIKEGEYGATVVVPYSGENKGMFGAGKEKSAVQQKSGSMIQKGTKKNNKKTIPNF